MEDKWLVGQNENLKKKKNMFLRTGWIPHALQHLAPITGHV